jgi:transposase-like protein
MTIRNFKDYDDAFRLSVVRDYLESGLSMYFIAHKYGLSCGAVVKRWMQSYPIAQKELSLSSETLSGQSMTGVEKRKEDLLQDRISKLERALALEKMRSHGYLLMIENAEKEEGISILKKGGAKQ